MKPLIVIPTLNESQSIGRLITGIVDQCPDALILVVDGNSDDGTQKIVLDIQKNSPNIKLISQNIPGSFGSALRTGFQYALTNNYDPVITMDGDLSHGPGYIKNFLDHSSEYDLIIGSRYINGVRVEGWKFRKLLMSKLANMYISYILVKPIWDFTSGFRCYRLNLLNNINIEQLADQAYMIQIQLLHLAFRKRFRVKEIPFVYRDHEDNISKVYPHSKRSTFFFVLKYRAPFFEILRHFTYVKKDYKRFVREYDELINPPRLKHEGQFDVKTKYMVSVGVMAYNEEHMLGACLDGLLNQKLNNAEIKEIIVVSSGSTDRTNEIADEYSNKHSKVKLITQPKRMGKASAINEFLSIASGDIVVLESADTTTEPETLEHLIQHFSDKEVGMVGAHPIPVNNPDTLAGYCVQKLWQLHHQMALENPKCGELVAFRNIVYKISDYTAVDEAVIESIFHHHGLKLEYAESAIINNKGPETLREFIRQRRRIASGHRHLLASTGHQVATYKSQKIIHYVLKSQSWKPKAVLFTFLMISIEAFSRFAGMIDYYVRDKNPFIWDISQTTKQI